MLTPDKIAQMDKITGLQQGPGTHPNAKSRIAELDALDTNNEPDYGQRVTDQYKEAGKSIVEDFKNNNLNRAPLTALHTVGNIAKATFAPITAAVSPTIEKVVGKISDQPKVQESALHGANAKVLSVFDKLKTIANEHPDIARSAEDLWNIANLFVGEKATTEVGSTAESVASKLKSTASEFTPPDVPPPPSGPTPKFIDNLNQALPVLKKDVKAGIETKYEKAHEAFSDIVANKDTIGIVDDAGEARLPKNFTETVAAQQNRLKDIYKGYSEQLSTIDKPKFEADIASNVSDQVKKLGEELKKENSVDGRRALTKIQGELQSLRDTSPEGIQNYIESINQRVKTAPGAPWTIEQTKLINLAGEMRKVLDTAVEKLNGPGYQELRNKYGAHKALQDQLMMAAKKEINNSPGLMDRFATAGFTLEGINFLLTHNPAALATGLGLKGVTAFTRWLKSPTRALRNIYRDLEKDYLNAPKSLNPDTTSQSAITEPINTNISESIPQVKKVSSGLSTPSEIITTFKNAKIQPPCVRDFMKILKKNPNAVPVRGILSDTIENASAVYKNNIQKGMQKILGGFNHVNALVDGELIKTTSTGAPRDATFFSEEEILNNIQ